MTDPVLPSVPTPFPPFVLHLPESAPIPLICDSPHSGTQYPDDFNFAINFDALRCAEDTYVNELWHAIPHVGGTLLAAQFPRSYIDPNRDMDDLDPALLSSPWPGQLHPTEKSRLGIGLIWKRIDEGVKSPIYDRLLSPEEVQNRLDIYYAPYHATLRQQIENAYAQHGAIWHLNLHSMPSNAYESLEIPFEHALLADFVLGNRDGSTCSQEFTHLVAQALRSKGYTVSINDPYKGVALIARLGRPAENRHSLQIEVHRGLYMNEKTHEKSSDFRELQTHLAQVSQEIASYISHQI